MPFNRSSGITSALRPPKLFRVLESWSARADFCFFPSDFFHFSFEKGKSAEINGMRLRVNLYYNNEQWRQRA